MKKLFTTMLVAMLTMVASAQIGTDPTMITFKPFNPGSNPMVFNCDKMFMYVVDDNNKMMCDEHIRTFRDGQRFTTRFKTVSTSGRASQIYLSIKAKGLLTIYATSASSEVDRQVVILKGAKDLVTDIVEQKSKRPITLEIDKPGEYQIMYPDGPINIYGIRFQEKKDEPAADAAAK